eukprot:283301_1
MKSTCLINCKFKLRRLVIKFSQCCHIYLHHIFMILRKDSSLACNNLAKVCISNCACNNLACVSCNSFWLRSSCRFINDKIKSLLIASNATIFPAIILKDVV